MTIKLNISENLVYAKHYIKEFIRFLIVFNIPSI
jgi:hypothetical protein